METKRRQKSQESRRFKCHYGTRKRNETDSLWSSEETKCTKCQFFFSTRHRMTAIIGKKKVFLVSLPTDMSSKCTANLDKKTINQELLWDIARSRQAKTENKQILGKKSARSMREATTDQVHCKHKQAMSSSKTIMGHWGKQKREQKWKRMFRKKKEADDRKTNCAQKKRNKRRPLKSNREVSNIELSMMSHKNACEAQSTNCQWVLFVGHRIIATLDKDNKEKMNWLGPKVDKNSNCTTKHSQAEDPPKTIMGHWGKQRRKTKSRKSNTWQKKNLSILHNGQQFELYWKHRQAADHPRNIMGQKGKQIHELCKPIFFFSSWDVKWS